MCVMLAQAVKMTRDAGDDRLYILNLFFSLVMDRITTNKLTVLDM
jgi:hypothetical protein